MSTVRVAAAITLLPLLLWSLPLGCGGGEVSSPPDGAEPGDDGADVDDDVIVPVEPRVRVALAASPGELVGGPVPFGEVGRAWILANERVRFMVQDVGVSTVYHLYGGSLVGADVVRPDGEADQSVLRELFPVVDFRIVDPERALVVDDGAESGRAILRFEGALQPTRIIDLLDLVAGTVPIEVAVEYELAEDADALIVRTLVHNPTAVNQAVLIGDFLVASKLLRLFAPDRGFDVRGAVGDVGWLAFRGDEVSYGYARADGEPLNAPFVESSGALAVHDFGFALAPGETRSFERHVMVARGGLAEVVAYLDDLSGVTTGTIVGAVRDPDGAPVPGVLVSALTSDDGAGFARNQAVTDDAGVFAMAVPPGTWSLVASGGERRPSPAVEVAVTVGAEATATLELAPAATVLVTVTGDGPQPVEGPFPVKVALRALDGDAQDPRLGDFPRVGGGWRVEFLGAGLGTLEVAPGRYDVVLSHGPGVEPLVFDDVLLTDGHILDGHLHRAVPTPGWLGCDFHQHTIGSLDSRTPFDVRVRENLAEGLECFATSEHDHIIDLRPLIAEMGASEALYSIVSDEISVNGVGHFNAYPMPLDLEDPFALVGVKLFAGVDIEPLFARLRDLEGDRILQVNHPRSNAIKGYFTHLGLDPWSLTTRRSELAGGWEALEVNSELGVASDYTVEGWAALRERNPASVPVMADWFGLLNAGWPICGVANSDCHDPADGCGWPRTYLPLGDDPATVTDADVIDAIRRQRAIGSRGIWLDLTVDGVFRMGHLDLVDASAGPVELRVVARTASIANVTRVELYGNGLFLESRPAAATPESDGTWIDTTFTLEPEVDTWYVVVARGDRDRRPIFGGSPYAYANPIYLDADGDGSFTAPGPVPLAEAGGD